ncbi:D-aminoacyl-tRNA deacylase [Candidatus Lokiarchaeum ossiferum]|uniref:D-aminoacyl-tRNA deacylase n=1 Tax=Candidatus Lokiarchaeum ossiferum TaxID=2951803 RepID=A0ABY6HX56_9ARCH|nr:D-aminoacyl-tRNA deacylase [Candidatus Lokiarchaeum sp. B-35]
MISDMIPSSLHRSTLQITIVTAQDDIASKTIFNALLASYPFEIVSNHPLRHHNSIQSLHCCKLSEGSSSVHFLLINVLEKMTNLDEIISPTEMPGDLLIFASRHQSKSGRPSLMCHTTGNLNEDIAGGGQPFRISIGTGIVLHYFFTLLSQYSTERSFGVPVHHEVDHHGPTEYLQPLVYIEQGSSEDAWKDPIGAKIIADVIMKTGIILTTSHYHGNQWDKKDLKICVGFGGGHYMPSFTPLISLGYSFVHTVPKYKILDLTSTMIEQIQQRTLEPIDFWVLDWKGLKSADKQHLIPLLEQTGIPIKKTKELRKLFPTLPK